jgi:cell division protein FtsI (penicillin-binding protein 3)
MAEAQGSSRFRIAWRGMTQHVVPRETPVPLEWRATIRSRLLVFASAFVLWTVAIEARLLYLQVWEHQNLVARAEDQQHSTIATPPQRGVIYDRFGNVLAISVDADTISADPSQVEDPDKAARLLCQVFEDCSASSLKKLTAELRPRTTASGKAVRHTYIARKVSPSVGRRVAALKLPGIIVSAESRRYYPNLMLGANFLGYVGTDNEGLGGLEAKFDDRIQGREGRLLIQRDGKKSAMAMREEQPATAGESIELTIDQTLQHIADRELRAGVKEFNAQAGMAIVMDPNSGEILALSNYPTYNPNAYSDSAPVDRANRAVQHIYEPGSTFKLVTAAAAIEERVLRPTDMINCAPGYIRVPGRSRLISDVHPYDMLSFEDVIVKSSNVGAVKAGQQIGAERLSIYVNRFGFGEVLSPDFSGQTRGIVHPASQLDISGLASVSMGYQVGVTPMQMAAAVSSIANGGTLYQPRMVRAFISNGRREPVSPKAVRRTVSPETAAVLTRIMEAVVERGTAKSAQIDGYTIAGKTGTARKAVPGGYSEDDYNVSFVGFAPSRKPAIAVVVVIDSPHGKVTSYGGTVAAPIFKRIAEASLRHLGIAPTINPAPPVLVARDGGLLDGIQAVRTTATPDQILAPARMGLMPDLRGLSARAAVQSLTRIGLGAQLEGNGFVVSQTPEAGSALVPGGTANLTLSRRPPERAAGGAQQ